jgi:hypothetical protein
MKFAVSSKQRDFYQKRNIIEFDGLLNVEQLASINSEIAIALSLQLRIPSEKLRTINAERQFIKGHDLWRTNESLKKSGCYSRFAETASDLLDVKPIRLGYDQFFPNPENREKFKNEEEIYPPFLENNYTLHQISSLQGLLCGLMLCINGDSPGDTVEGDKQSFQSVDPIDIFSTTKGNGIFFKPDVPINFSKLLTIKKCQYLLITYTQATTVYVLQETDPFSHQLKHLGYGFGDRLSDKQNPVLYR